MFDIFHIRIKSRKANILKLIGGFIFIIGLLGLIYSFYLFNLELDKVKLASNDYKMAIKFYNWCEGCAEGNGLNNWESFGIISIQIANILFWLMIILIGCLMFKLGRRLFYTEISNNKNIEEQDAKSKTTSKATKKRKVRVRKIK